MTTYDLRTQNLTVDDLLRLAADATIKVISRDGQAFVIGVAEDFDQEVARLGQSRSFRAFLAERSKQKNEAIAFEEFERTLTADSTGNQNKT